MTVACGEVVSVQVFLAEPESDKFEDVGSRPVLYIVFLIFKWSQDDSVTQNVPFADFHRH